MARRTNIRRRGKSWVVYFRVNGRQIWRTFSDREYGGSAGAREAAELYLAQSQAKRIRGEFRRPVKMRFGDFAAEWLKVYAKPNVKVRTYEAYETSLRVHLVPEFGDLLLSEISRKAIDSLVADWLAGGPDYQERVRLAREIEAKRAKEEDRDPRPVKLGRSPGTISNALTPLREMLGHAVEWEYLTANPALGVKRPRIERTEMHVLGAEEVGKLLEAARDRRASAYAYPLLLTAVTTGVRRGELLALRWGDVDWNSGRVWVRRNVTRSGRFQEPKTRGSVRAIAMMPSLATALRLHRMASAWKDEDDLLFPSETGGPLDGGNLVRREFKPALRRAGLPQIRFHDLRHSFASLLIAQGEHPKLISEQLGHASVQITLDRYGHLLPASYDSAGERLEAALFGAGSAAFASAGPDNGFRAVPPAGDGESASPVVMPLSAAGGGTD
jgi:integrase